MLDSLTLGTFTPLVNETFALGEGAAAVDARLERADAGRPAAGRQRDPFSLVFVAPAAGRARQGVYRVSHPLLGPLDLFLVPLGPGPDGMRFEAVFT